MLHFDKYFPSFCIKAKTIFNKSVYDYNLINDTYNMAKMTWLIYMSHEGAKHPNVVSQLIAICSYLYRYMCVLMNTRAVTNRHIVLIYPLLIW